MIKSNKYGILKDDNYFLRERIFDDHVANFHAYGGPNGPDMRPTFLKERRENTY